MDHLLRRLDASLEAEGSTRSSATTPGKVPATARLGARRAEARSADAATSGSALPGELQGKMEDAFDFDFSGVRVHQDGQAAAVGARAFARGADLHFAPGHYDPGSQRGAALLGHELAHVVQQSEGRVAASTQFKGLAVNDDAALEAEADAWGAAAARGEAIHRSSDVRAVSAGPALQRRVIQGHDLDMALAYPYDMIKSQVDAVMPMQQSWKSKNDQCNASAFAQAAAKDSAQRKKMLGELNSLGTEQKVKLGDDNTVLGQKASKLQATWKSADVARHKLDMVKGDWNAAVRAAKAAQADVDKEKKDQDEKPMLEKAWDLVTKCIDDSVTAVTAALKKDPTVVLNPLAAGAAASTAVVGAIKDNASSAADGVIDPSKVQAATGKLKQLQDAAGAATKIADAAKASVDAVAKELSAALVQYRDAESEYRDAKENLYRHAKAYATDKKNPTGPHLEQILVQCGAMQDKEVTAQILEDAIKRDIHDVGVLLKLTGNVEALPSGTIDEGGAPQSFFRIAGQRYYVPARIKVSAIGEMHGPAAQMKAFLDGRAAEKENAAAWKSLAAEANLANAATAPTPGPGGS